MTVLERYTADQQKVMEEYWETIRFTRTTGKISDGIKQREYAYWSKFEPEIVIEALKIHIQRHPTHREGYTRGIMRNIKNSKGAATCAKPERSHAVTTPASKHSQEHSRKRDSNAEEAFRRRIANI